MATIDEPQTLVSCAHPAHVVGATAYERGASLVTIQGQGVQIHNVLDRKITKAWATPATSVWSSAAVHANGFFFAVRANNVVHRWSESSERIDRGSCIRHTFNGAHIAPTLVPLHGSYAGILIAFENASVAVFADDAPDKPLKQYATPLWHAPCPAATPAAAASKSKSTPKKQRAAAAAAATAASTLVAFTPASADVLTHLGTSATAGAAFVVATDGSGGHTVSVVVAHETDRTSAPTTAHTWTLAPPTPSNTPSTSVLTITSCSIGMVSLPSQSSSSSLLIVTLWSDAHLRTHTLGRSSLAPISIDRHLSNTVLAHTSRVSLVANSPCALVAHSASQHTSHMVLWDIRYGVVLASSSPPSSSSSSSSTASHLVSLSPCNALAQSFLLSARDSVTVWTLRLPSTQSGSLLSVLGRMEDTREELAATSRNTVVQPPVVATVTAPTDLVEQAAWQTAVAEAVALEQSLSSSLNESRSPAAFQAAFERLWNASAPVAHRAALASPAFVARVLDRCLSDAAFRPSGVLVAVVEAGRVPARAIPALVDVCIDDANLRLLEALLVHAHAMPEEQLVRCLRFVLAGAGGSARAYVGERTAVARKGVPAVHALDDRDSPRDALLHLCVSAPRNDAFLVDQLRLLDVAETTDLLAYLLRWLDRYENISAEQLRNSCNSRIPSQTQVLDWIGLVLDASLTRLLLLPSCHEQLAQLAGSLSLATDACSSMSVLRGHLEQLLERKTMPTATDAAALYTIEVLRL